MEMKNSMFAKALMLSLILMSAGCQREDGNEVSEVYGVESPGPEPEPGGADSGDESGGHVSSGENLEPPELLDGFLAGEVPALYVEGTGMLMVSDLTFDEEDYFSYSVGERIDLDNDGVDEQILKGPYGGIYLDARDGKVCILAVGEGTAGVLFYTHFDSAVWIGHCDVTHMGRQVYWMEKYDGSGKIVDEFKLSAEYWDSPDDRYDENSEFTYRDEQITMTEFEALRDQILGMAALPWGDS